MKLTPLDIARRDFGLALRGYHRGEVDEFLANVQEEFERIYKENNSLKEEVVTLSRQVEQYHTMEDLLKNSILLAQKVAEDIRANAQKEAELVLGQARADRQKNMEEANRELEQIRSLSLRIRIEMQSFLQLYQDLLTQSDQAGGSEAS
ncbi:MAG: DivIVA domain-containing protein [bacterium]